MKPPQIHTIFARVENYNDDFLAEVIEVAERHEVVFLELNRKKVIVRKEDC